MRASLAAAAFATTIVLVAATASAERPADGRAEPSAREDYVLNCSGCHRVSGAGVAGAVPALVALDRVAADDEGRIYLVRAPGVAQAPLSDARLARLLNWLVATFGEAGRPPSPRYTAGEVGRLRTSPLRAPAAARERITARLGD